METKCNNSDMSFGPGRYRIIFRAKTTTSNGGIRSRSCPGLWRRALSKMAGLKVSGWAMGQSWRCVSPYQESSLRGCFQNRMRNRRFEARRSSAPMDPLRIQVVHEWSGDELKTRDAFLLHGVTDAFSMFITYTNHDIARCPSSTRLENNILNDGVRHLLCAKLPT